MRRIILTIFIGFLVYSCAFSQKTAIKINLPNLATQTVQIGCEWQVLHGASFAFWLDYQNVYEKPALFFGWNTIEYHYNIFGMNTEFRFYIEQDYELEGFYLAPNLTYRNATISYSDISKEYNGWLISSKAYKAEGNTTISKFGLGLAAGYQQTFLKDKLVLDFAVGLNYGFLSTKTIDYSGFILGPKLPTGTIETTKIYSNGTIEKATVASGGIYGGFLPQLVIGLGYCF